MSSRVRPPSKLQLWLILGSLAALFYAMSQLEADIAVSVSGKSVRGAGNTVIRSEVEAAVERVHIAEGDRVSPGTSLLSLRTRDVTDELRALQEELAGAQTSLQSKQLIAAAYRRERDSIKTLVEKKLEPAGELRQADLALAKAEAETIEAEAQIKVLEAQVTRLTNRLSKYDVQASASGRVLRLFKYSVGDVVRAGDAVAEIVPSDGKVSFEAKVDPADISSVSVGNEAAINFVSANRYEVDPFEGEVTYVSPSSIEGDDGSVYFLATVELNEGQYQREDISFLDDVGQVVDISVRSGQRSVLAFVLSPLVRGAERVFQER